MLGFRKKTTKCYENMDFNTCVRQKKVVPTRIYTRGTAFGFRTKERGTIFGNVKRGKRLKIKG